MKPCTDKSVARQFVDGPEFAHYILPGLERLVRLARGSDAGPPPEPSKHIGMKQEARIRCALFDRMPFAKVSDTSGQPHCMDIRVELPCVGSLPGRVAYVESKNVRTSNVSSAELRKFEADYGRLPDADAAVLIARRRVDVTGGYSTAVAPNLRRVDARHYYVDHMDLDALTLALYLIWATGAPRLIENGDGTLRRVVNSVLRHAARALDIQKAAIGSALTALTAFKRNWFTETRGLAQSLADLRECTDGDARVECVFSALSYRACSAKRRPPLR